ncbi:hypothetical protein MASR2M15_06100 [Anaerolineales bacterium]
MDNTTKLRFDGSVWCNLDIALRSLDQLYRRSISSIGLTVIEWYILRALYVQDGQHASQLAKAVGRAATSFTPNLDKLEKKGFIERRADPSDRRAIRIFLTELAEERREAVLEAVDVIQQEIGEIISEEELAAFQRVVAALQSINR